MACAFRNHVTKSLAQTLNQVTSKRLYLARFRHCCNHSLGHSFHRTNRSPPNRMTNISFAGAKKRKTRHPGYVFRMSRHKLDHTTPALSCLLLLVDELLLNIIDHIDNREALIALASTCTHLQSLVEPYIWRDLLVLTGRHARHISQALDSEDRRVGYVQSLSVRYENKYKHGIEELNFFISLMSRLRHLTIESPCPNNSEWRAGNYFDGHSRLDYANLLAGAIYSRAEMSPTLPILQTRRYRASCFTKCTLMLASQYSRPWRWRPEVSPWPCEGNVLSSQSPADHLIVLGLRRRDGQRSAS